MKTKYKIILILIAFVVTISIFSFIELTHSEPNMTLEEFEERFGDEDIVKHFKSVYPNTGVGWGKSPGMMMPAWGYLSAKESIISELRVESNFGKYEFTYTCGEIADDWFPHVKIKNPSRKDIDENPCWNTLR